MILCITKKEGYHFLENEIKVIDSDEEYESLIKISAKDNISNEVNPNLILNYMLNNEEGIERVELLNSKFDEKYISKKLYFNHIGSYVRVRQSNG